jgi:hypothetical protein
MKEKSKKSIWHRTTRAIKIYQSAHQKGYKIIFLAETSISIWEIENAFRGKVSTRRVNGVSC